MQEASGGGGWRGGRRGGRRGGDPCHRGVAVLGTDPGNARPTRSRDFPTKNTTARRPPPPSALWVEPLIWRGAAMRTRAHICTRINQASPAWRTGQILSPISAVWSHSESKTSRRGPNVEPCPPPVETCVVVVV